MSYPPAPETDFSPTAQLPRVGRRRRFDSGGPSRLIWVLVAAAVVMTIAAVIAVLTVGDDDTPPLVAPPAASEADVPTEEPDPAYTEAAPLLPSLPPPSSAAPRPSATPAAQSRLRPAEIVAALRATVRALVADGQLSRRGGELLDDRLRSIAGLIADGKLQRARKQVNDLARNVVALHEDGKVSDRGYQTLIAGISLLQQALGR